MLSNKLNQLLINAIEFVTMGIKAINTDHANIHKGLGRITSEYLTLSGNGTQEYCIETDEERYVHFKNLILMALGSSVSVSILEDATITLNTGDELLVSNPNSVSTNISGTTIRKNPSYTGGTIMDRVCSLADSTNQSVGISSITTDTNEELVFKPNTQYIIKLEELKGDSVELFWRAFFYEEEEGVS